MRTADRATLATGLHDGDHWPYPSLVLVGLDHDGSPLLLISRLAEHTRNLTADPRVGLLFDGTMGLDEPLTGARVSVLGRAVVSDLPRHRQRYLARHPSAEFYAGFADFAVWRVVVERAHLVAGFGRIHWIPAGELLLGPPETGSLAEDEAGILAHINADHAAVLELTATALLGRAATGPEAAGWRLTGIDPDGCDLRRGGELARLGFPQPVASADAARRGFVALAGRAREAVAKDDATEQ